MRSNTNTANTVAVVCVRPHLCLRSTAILFAVAGALIFQLEHVFFSGAGARFREHVCSGFCVSGAGLFLLCLTKDEIYKSIMIN